MSFNRLRVAALMVLSISIKRFNSHLVKEMICHAANTPGLKTVQSNIDIVATAYT